MLIEKIYKNLKLKMDNALLHLNQELNGLRTNRASIHLLDHIIIESYGNKAKISQLASLFTPDSRTIIIQVWDKNIIKAIEKGIIDAQLNLNPLIEGQNIKIIMPLLTEDHRKQLIKSLYKYGENSKITMRNIRRETNEKIKNIIKENTLSKDKQYQILEQIQKLTDEYIKNIDIKIKNKEPEILNI